MGRKVPFIIEVVDGGIPGLPRLLDVPNLRIGDSFCFRVFARNRRHEAEFVRFFEGNNKVGKTRVADPPDLLPLSLRALEAPNLLEPLSHILFGELEVNPQYLALNFLR